MINLDESSNIMTKSDTSFHISGDVERNIPIITIQVLKESAEEVVKTGYSIPNSRIVLKNIIESRMNNLHANYEDNTGVTVKMYNKISGIFQ